MVAPHADALIDHVRANRERYLAELKAWIAVESISAQAGGSPLFAEELARKFGSEIIVLHVDQPLAPVMVSELGPAFDVSAMNQIAEEQRLSAQRQLDKIVTQLRDAALKARSLMRVGAPFLEIIHAARTEAVDLIVLGTHGRTGLAHVLLGSVAERVVQKAGCAVLTVRHPDRRFKHPLDK